MALCTVPGTWQCTILIVQQVTMTLHCAHAIVAYAQSLRMRAARRSIPRDGFPVGQQLGHAEADQLSVFVIIVSFTQGDVD
jgi:hypothetical protein